MCIVITAVHMGTAYIYADLSNSVGVALGIRPKRFSCFPQVVELYSAALSRGAEMPVVPQLRRTTSNHKQSKAISTRCVHRWRHGIRLPGIHVRLLRNIYHHTWCTGIIAGLACLQ